MKKPYSVKRSLQETLFCKKDVFQLNGGITVFAVFALLHMYKYEVFYTITCRICSHNTGMHD